MTLMGKPSVLFAETLDKERTNMGKRLSSQMTTQSLLLEMKNNRAARPKRQGAAPCASSVL